MNGTLCTESGCGTGPHPRHTAPDDRTPYERTLDNRQGDLALAELDRLDKQYPVWQAGCYSAWASERRAYVAGDDSALDRMYSIATEDHPVLWGGTPAGQRAARHRQHEIRATASRHIRTWAAEDAGTPILIVYVALVALLSLMMVIFI